MVTRRRFGQEFKLEAVQLVKGRGVSVAQAARDLGVHENVLRKWVKQLPAEAQGGLAGTGPIAAQAELARLRKENAKLRMERDILKPPRPTSRRSRCEIRLSGEASRNLAGFADVRGARCLAKRLLRLVQSAAEPAQS